MSEMGRVDPWSFFEFMTNENSFDYLDSPKIIRPQLSSRVNVTQERIDVIYNQLMGFKNHILQVDKNLNDNVYHDERWKYYGPAIERVEQAYTSKNLEEFKEAILDVLVLIPWQ